MSVDYNREANLLPSTTQIRSHNPCCSHIPGIGISFESPAMSYTSVEHSQLRTCALRSHGLRHKGPKILARPRGHDSSAKIDPNMIS